MKTNLVSLKSVVFNSGDRVDVSDSNVVVFVGPNNSGKTRLLQEIAEWVSSQPGYPQSPRLVTESVELSLGGITPTEMVEWMEENKFAWTPAQHSDRLFRTPSNSGSSEIRTSDITQCWEAGRSSGGQLGVLGGHLTKLLSCSERLTNYGPPSRIDLDRPTENPIQAIAVKPILRDKLARLLHQAFGLNLILDGWGPNYFLRLSESESQAHFAIQTDDGIAPMELRQRLHAVPTLGDQSDGIRSFTGILLTLLAGSFPLTLVDEPEAFLHPPQARLLGRLLPELSGNGQVLIATHSTDVLAGVLESKSAQISVVRLTRSQGRTFARRLASADIQGLWNDPVVRHTKVLDGLFHDGVVVCEGDVDVAFYRSVADAVLDASERPKPLDVLFVQAGGKQRIARIATAMHGLGVPVCAIADFDMLETDWMVASCIRAMGNEITSEIEQDLKAIHLHLSGGDPTTLDNLRQILQTIMDESSTEEGLRTNLREALRPASGWKKAKSRGLREMSDPDGSAIATRLIASLKGRRLFIVPTGEVESFVETVRSTKSKWLLEVLERGLAVTSGDARTFVSEVLAVLSPELARSTSTGIG